MILELKYFVEIWQLEREHTLIIGSGGWVAKAQQT